MFYGAGTLILLLATSDAQSAAEDVALAGQNLMLAACDAGLGSCPIGLSRAYLNLPEVKAELGIPTGYAVFTPLIVGHPAQIPEPTSRKETQILFWR